MKARKYYFVDEHYHDWQVKRQDEARMSEHGEVGHDDEGRKYWIVAQPKAKVVSALKQLGYRLAQ